VSQSLIPMFSDSTPRIIVDLALGVMATILSTRKRTNLVA
jgi:hypothetical protein